MSFKPFPNTFVTNGTTQQFLTSITGSNLPVGMAYLGQVSLSDMPDGVTVQAEVEVYIYPQNVAYCVMRSAEVAPYVWECNSYEYRGWESFTEEDPEIFWWTGSKQDPDIPFWNKVYRAQKRHPVWVICAGGSQGGTIPHFYHLHNSIQNNTTIYSTGLSNNWSSNIGNDSFAPNPSVLQLSPVTWRFTFTVVNNVITAVTMISEQVYLEVLATNKNYNTPYTPQYNGSPATKKYVDDAISTNITNVLGGSY